MRHFFAAGLLALPLAASALDVGVSVGSAISSDTSSSTSGDTAVTQLSAHLHFAGNWAVGLEGLYRQSEALPALAFNPNGYDTSTQSVGLELRYSQRLLGRHRVGVGGSAGANQASYAHPGQADQKEHGRYRAASAFYDFLATENFSLGVSARRQKDHMEPDALSSPCLNCGGLNNIVYNPYAGLNADYKTRLKTFSLNIGYRF